MAAIPYLRTPDERFAELKDYPFVPHYATVQPGDLRMHYVDEGPRNGPVVLLMHGEPSWSYLYRKVIPPLVKRGCRVIAPDLIGFGKSDKPIHRHDYTYDRHISWVESLVIHTLNLKDITLFCQDWGGLISLRIVAKYPDRFARLVIANSGLPTGEKATEGFLRWLNFSQRSDELDVGFIIGTGCAKELSEETVKGYDAPFPEGRYQAGVLQFPTLVPITKNADALANEKAWEVLSRFTKPVLLAFSDKDPITKGGDGVFLRRVPGTKNQPHTTVQNGGHFLQEDQPEQIAQIIGDLIARNTPSSKL